MFLIAFSVMQQALKLFGNHLLGPGCLIHGAAEDRWYIVQSTRLWEGLSVLTWKYGKVLVTNMNKDIQQCIHTVTACIHAVAFKNIWSTEWIIVTLEGHILLHTSVCMFIKKINVIIRKIIKLQRVSVICYSCMYFLSR